MAAESDKLSPKSETGEFTGWSTLADRYDVGSTTDKFNCFVDAISQAIEMVRVEGNDPRVLLELLLQLEDKRDGTNSSLLDFSAGKGQKGGRPAEFSSNLKKVNAAAAIDAFMALGFTAKEAAERAGQELLVSSDSVLRWRKRFRSEDVHLWSSEYHSKISALHLLEKNEVEKIIPIFLNAAKRNISNELKTSSFNKFSFLDLTKYSKADHYTNIHQCISCLYKSMYIHFAYTILDIKIRVLLVI